MKDLWELIIFVLFVLGGGCSLAGTWWCKNKKKKKNANEHQNERISRKILNLLGHFKNGKNDEK